MNSRAKKNSVNPSNIIRSGTSIEGGIAAFAILITDGA
jgi:hypothetical protein